MGQRSTKCAKCNREGENTFLHRLRNNIYGGARIYVIDLVITLIRCQSRTFEDSFDLSTP